jgi:hypothetical protein
LRGSAGITDALSRRRFQTVLPLVWLDGQENEGQVLIGIGEIADHLLAVALQGVGVADHEGPLGREERSRPRRLHHLRPAGLVAPEDLDRVRAVGLPHRGGDQPFEGLLRQVGIGSGDDMEPGLRSPSRHL